VIQKDFGRADPTILARVRSTPAISTTQDVFLGSVRNGRRFLARVHLSFSCVHLTWGVQKVFMEDTQ